MRLIKNISFAWNLQKSLQSSFIVALLYIMMKSIKLKTTKLKPITHYIISKRAAHKMLIFMSDITQYWNENVNCINYRCVSITVTLQGQVG